MGFAVRAVNMARLGDPAEVFSAAADAEEIFQ